MSASSAFSGSTTAAGVAPVSVCMIITQSGGVGIVHSRDFENVALSQNNSVVIYSSY
jgi:hypothetical protein